jgi:LmbE family N-acetylglucosaminyl deacetylase
MTGKRRSHLEVENNMAGPGTVLSLLAHPDDAEILCAGTMAHLASRGWRCHVATFTAGDCGSAELDQAAISKIRRAEALAAATLLPGGYDCLEEKDLLLFYAPRPLRKVVSLLRRVRPTVVLAHSPADYMADHEMASLLVRAGCFNAAVPNLFPRTGAPALEHIPALYYCDPLDGVDPMGRPVQPAMVVDVGSTLDLKEKMLACHASQRDWLARQHGMDQYLVAMRDFAKSRGSLAGISAGEGFRQHLGHGYTHENLLAKALGGLCHQTKPHA